MMLSVKKNLALRRGRNQFFDRNVDIKAKRYVGEIPRVSAQVREKFRQKLQEEKRRDRKVLLYSIIATVVLGALVYIKLMGLV